MYLMLSSRNFSSTNDLSEWDKKGQSWTGKELCVEFLLTPWIPQYEALTFGFASLEKLTRTQEVFWTFRFLRVWWRGGGGGPLRTENVKYAVLNSQQGNSGLKHRGTLRKADCLDFRVLNPQPRCVTVYSSTKGKTEAQGQICISIQWSIWIAALSTHNTCFVGEKSPAAECTRNTLRSPPRIWSMWGINQSILISVIQNKQLLYLAGLT